MRLGILIGVLATAVVALGVALAVVIGDDDSNSDQPTTVTRNVTNTTKTVTTPAKRTATTGQPNVRRLQSFKSPSSNIGCQLAGGVARCDIRERSWSPPPKPSSCSVDWGQGISVSRTGPAEFVCAGDTALDESATVLAYGDNARFGAFLCRSRENGVTCESSSSGRGFLVNRERYRLF